MKSLIVSLAILSAVLLCAAAPEGDLIKSLPDWPAVTYPMYAGHLDIDTQDGKTAKSVFYFHHASQSNSKVDPVIFWVAGGANGPGCSSFISMVRGLGAVTLAQGASTWSTDEFALNKAATIVFLDAPSGVGFSIRNISIHPNFTYENACFDVKDAIITYFDKFPELATNDVYIAGEGWTGVIIPRVIELLSIEKKTAEKGAKVNVKGGIIGNGEMDANPVHRERSRNDFYWGHQLYNIETREIISSVCVTNPSTPRCIFAKETINRLKRGINPFDVNANCVITNVTGYTQPGWIPCVDYSNIYAYFTRPDVRLALNVSSQVIWLPCNEEINNVYPTPDSAIKNLGGILKEGYKVLYFSGDLDSTYPFNEAFTWIPKLNLEVEKSWREYKVFNRVAGHVINYNKGLTYATVRGAGMNAFTRKRQQVFHLLGKFITGKNPDEQ